MSKVNSIAQEYFDLVTTGMLSIEQQTAELDRLKQHLDAVGYSRIKTFEHQKRQYLQLISETDLKNRNFDDNELTHIEKATAEYEAAVDKLPIKGLSKALLYELSLFGKEKFNFSGNSIYDTLEKQLKQIRTEAKNDVYVGNVIYHTSLCFKHEYNVRKSFLMHRAQQKLHDKSKFPKEYQKYLADYNKYVLKEKHQKNKEILKEIYQRYKQADNKEKISLLLKADKLVTHTGKGRVESFNEQSIINYNLSELYANIGDMDNRDYYAACAKKYKRLSKTAQKYRKKPYNNQHNDNYSVFFPPQNTY